MANYVKQTWTDGSSQATAARMGVIEQGIFDAHFQPAARVYRTATLSIANSTVTAVNFDVEAFDTDTIHDTVTNNNRLTCKTAGKYYIHAKVRFDANAGGFREAYIRNQAGTLVAHSGSTIPSAWAGNFCPCECSATVDLAVNDWLEVVVQQSSGGALNLIATAVYEPVFEMFRVA